MKPKNNSLEVLCYLVIALVAVGLTYAGSIVIVDPASTWCGRLLAVPMVISLYVVAPPVQELMSCKFVGWSGSILIYGSIGVALLHTARHFVKKLIGRGGSGGTRI